MGHTSESTFRTATEADIPALAKLRWDFRTEEDEVPVEGFAEFARRYARFFEDGTRAEQLTHCVAEIDGQIVANMAVQIVRSIPRPSRLGDQWGYLTDCYTKPEFRDRGIGSELINHVVKWAKENDLEIILVFPSDRSVSVYKRAGFGPSETLQLRLREWND